MGNAACKILAFGYKSIYALLSARIKRLVFWGTVSGYIDGSPSGSTETLARVNKTLNLCEDAAALAYPAAMRRYVLSDPQFKRAADAIKDCVKQKRQLDTAVFTNLLPRWFVYGGDTKISHDASAFVAAEIAAA